MTDVGVVASRLQAFVSTAADVADTPMIGRHE
jgi:hypothetical protein